MPPQYQGETFLLLLGTLFSVTSIRQGLLQAEPQGCLAWLHSVGTSKDWLISHLRLGLGAKGEPGE